MVADLSVNNPNVWYELGVRHALRRRGVIPIQCKRDYLPFDVYSERSLRYAVTDATPTAPSVPDPARLEQDRQALGRFARETIESWDGRTISPVYLNLRDLPEPDWRQLRSDQAREFWARHREWAGRIEVARRGGRPGDILLLATEAPARVFRVDALKVAGQALRSLGRFTFALDQFEAALELVPDDLEARRQKGILLGRLGRLDAAQQWLSTVAGDHPRDAESLALLGRVEKDGWVAAWRKPGATAEEMRRDAAYEDARLREAIGAYARAFKRDPSHYYSGINALDSSRQQLLLLQDLEFRPDAVEAALRAVRRELDRLEAPRKAWEPRQVFLFSGHMIDAPGRPEPRFPADKEPNAAAAIAAKLDELGAGADDLALCGGACGGDLLFAEACLQRGVRLEIRLPFDEPTFLQRSVSFAGAGWVERFYRVKADPKATLFMMPDELGPVPDGGDPSSPGTICGNSTAPFRGVPRRCGSSACGTARAATGRAGPSTCTTRWCGTRAACTCWI